MRPTTVLVTAAGTATALNVLRALHEQDALALRLVGCDTNPSELVAGARLCAAFQQVPPSDDPGYWPALRDLCERECIDLLIPVVDGEVEVAARMRDELARLGVRTLLPPLDVVVACNDK